MATYRVYDKDGEPLGYAKVRRSTQPQNCEPVTLVGTKRRPGIDVETIRYYGQFRIMLKNKKLFGEPYSETQGFVIILSHEEDEFLRETLATEAPSLTSEREAEFDKAVTKLMVSERCSK